MYFSVTNHKHINTTLKMADNTGIGIHNTKRRLDLLYEDRYKLTIDDGPVEFSVYLNIQV